MCCKQMQQNFRTNFIANNTYTLVHFIAAEIHFHLQIHRVKLNTIESERSKVSAMFRDMLWVSGPSAAPAAAKARRVNI